MRKLSLYMMIFGLITFTAACDSNDDSNDASSDADMFVGTWAVVGLADASGDRSAGLAEDYNSVVIAIAADKSVSLSVDGKDPIPDQAYSGTSSVNESTKTLTATLTVQGQPTPLSFTYTFMNDTTAALTASGTTALLLGVLFQTSYANPVVFTVTKI
ncbi:MAG: hypothetical protein O2797_03260 [Bacteroidetes bacterium]|nr:hypothetical protein [Bacteroidota bacterium]MDA1333220.1 hypothetical protein [Bacteroidota bacterium]